jgi:hypothetical protein
VRLCGGGVGAQHLPQLPAARCDPRGVRRWSGRGCAAVDVPRAAACGGRKGAFGRDHVSGAGARGWPAWGSLRVGADATCALRVGGATGRVCWAGEVRWPPLRVGSRGGVRWELPPARRCSVRWRVSLAAGALCPAWVGAAGAPRAVRCAARQCRPVATHLNCGRGRGVLAWRHRDGSSAVGAPARVSRCPLEPRGIQVGCEVHACGCVAAAWGCNTSHSCLPRGVIPVVCVAGQCKAARLLACPVRRPAGGARVRLGGVTFLVRGRVAGPRGAHCVWSATRRARCVSAGRRGGGVGRVRCVGPR